MSSDELAWKKLRERPLDAGYRKVVRRSFRLPDGREEDFDVKLEPEVVCVLALTKDRRVILARQFRPGPERVLSEMPGGTLEKAERPEIAAARELLEETGYAGRMEFVATLLDCGYSTSLRHVFIAHDCVEQPSPPYADPNEFIRTETVPLEDFLKLLRQGSLTDAEVGYRALDHLGYLKLR